MVGAMQNAPPPTSSSQLVAIEALRALLEKWQLLAQPLLLQYSRAPRLPRPAPTLQRSAPPTPMATQDQTNNPFHALEQDNCEEDVPSAPPWLPSPLPASVPHPPVPALHSSRFLKATPTRLVFEAAPTPTPQQPLLPPLPRVSPPPSTMPQHIPVAHQTRARLAAPQLNSLVELVQYHVPTVQLCSFLVVAGNSSQNENTFLQKKLIGLLYYDPLVSRKYRDLSVKVEISD
jgi:hypothetical protein